MYKEPYNNRISLRMTKEVDKTNEKIADELCKENGQPDKHKILKLYEQRLMQGGMMNEFNGVYGKFQNPW